jgi:hypothetical protein
MNKKKSKSEREGSVLQDADTRRVADASWTRDVVDHGK